MISYLSLAHECAASNCPGGNAKCCSNANGDTYYQQLVYQDF